jgi:hypothetical protein
MKYGYKDFSSLPIPADVSGKELERISKKHKGFLSPEIVLEESRNKNSPLHPCFNWDDKSAAEECRLEKARYILRVVVIIHDEKLPPVRAFIAIKDEPNQVGHSYYSMGDIVNSTVLRERVLQQAYREMQTFMNKYQHLQEVFSVVSEMKKIIKQKGGK